MAVEDGQTLLTSRYGLATKKYNETWTDVIWETCSLREWLNGTFYNSAFTSTVKAKIREVWNSNPDNPTYGTEGGKDTQDKIFLLSISEAEKYMTVKSSRQCKATDHAKENGAYADDSNGYSWWWLRSPGFTRDNAAIVNTDSSVSVYGICYSGGVVRPALWMKL